MKATFALLADREASNLVRRLAWQIHAKHRTGLAITRLPPHISLKQPFEISDLAGLEAYMLELASGTRPFDIQLTRLQLMPIEHEGMQLGLLWMDVQEHEMLRRLHDTLNRELEARFGNTAAAFDGEGYHFHMTVMMGGQPYAVYEQLFEEMPVHEINMQITVRQLAMFVYDEPLGPGGEYMLYRVEELSEDEGSRFISG